MKIAPPFYFFNYYKIYLGASKKREVLNVNLPRKKIN